LHTVEELIEFQNIKESEIGKTRKIINENSKKLTVKNKELYLV